MKRQESDTYRIKSEELEAKVSELATRLENQTLEVIRLSAELEEYEYKSYLQSGANNDDDEPEAVAAAATAVVAVAEEEEEEESEYEDFDGETEW